ncbi:MAG: PEP-CTERM sorting domain-containing protein [Planctomycetota bacterium]
MKNLAFVCSLVASSAVATAQDSAVIGGSTSVALDTDLLETAAGLTLTGAAGTDGLVTLPGAVAFPITGGTDFAYTAGDFPGGPFSGAITHTGTVTFNTDTTVGDFTIGFDASRATDGRSGFFVESTTGLEAIVFDTAVTGLASASEFKLDLSVDLLVSPEFAGVLGDNSLIGADVGDARILAAVPEPTSIAAALVAALGVAGARRRR